MSVDRIPEEISIFLVEDDEEDAILFREYLSEIPFPKFVLQRYKDGPSALDALRSSGPVKNQIYVLDHFLGSQNGIDLLNDIRSVIDGPVSAILVSGLSKEELEILAKKSGFAGYLEKRNLAAGSLSEEFLNILFRTQRKDISPERKVSEENARVARMETIAQFGGGIAHDFNNILNIIIANLDLLEIQCKEQPEIINRIRSAQNAVMRAADVNKKLLNFSRKQSLRQELTDPNELIREFLKKSQELFPTRIRVTFDPEERGDRCLIDSSEFASSLTQLFQNAIEANEDKEGEILVETIRVVSNFQKGIPGLEDGNFFLLKITDTGIGIQAENWEKIFDPFYSTKPKGKSSGLGLSMVYGFVKRSKGHIFFQSNPGIGTEFYLYFPILELKSDRLIPGNAKKQSREIFYFHTEGPFADWIIYFLRSLGYAVHKVPDLKDLGTNPEFLKKDSCLISETWKPGFAQWFEFAITAKRDRSQIEIYYFSSQDWPNNFENSFQFRWPITRKSLENHFAKL
ncbi:hybrid sensor histidine kinase/response regulator [Leptospira sp. 201903070]|uniref:histidine kinase n=1 Tax=Leptospira ainlahdjerensis TaxID=2810033 RepID=A0ABS2U9X1_9LEPT|nr:hybrid sensor histidine kinase/response regulator [Leptospira ainlahdjerensis]MBM9577156.1 hybrid sensor histidine kinase/response regulator [Leptospira ainlahdjerensis]